MEPIIITEKFNCNIEKVWEVLSNETDLKKWYFPVQYYKFEVGKTFTFYENCDSSEYLHQCKFITIEQHKIIEYTWAHPTHSKGSSVVRWTFEIIDENTTLVTLTHTGVESFADAGASFSKANFEMGWNAIVKTLLRNYLYGIEKLKFEISMNASAEKVWHALWQPENYKIWAAPFCEGSYFTGKIIQNERIYFLAPSGEGMYSDVLFCKENELVVFKHIGMFKNKEEMPIDEETKKWTGSFESYYLTANGNDTKLNVEVDAMINIKDYLNSTFPQALQNLKKLAEN